MLLSSMLEKELKVLRIKGVMPSGDAGSLKPLERRVSKDFCSAYSSVAVK